MRLPRAFPDISGTCGFWVRVINLVANTTHSPQMTLVFNQHHSPKLPTALGTCASNLPTTLHLQPFVRFRRAVVPFGGHFRSTLASPSSCTLIPVGTKMPDYDARFHLSIPGSRDRHPHSDLRPVKALPDLAIGYPLLRTATATPRQAGLA